MKKVLSLGAIFSLICSLKADILYQGPVHGPFSSPKAACNTILHN